MRKRLCRRSNRRAHSRIGPFDRGMQRLNYLPPGLGHRGWAGCGRRWQIQFDLRLAAFGDDEHLTGHGLGCGWSHRSNFREAGPGPADQIRIVAAFEDLHDQMATFLEQFDAALQHDVAEVDAAEMIRVAMSRRVRGHVRKHDVEQGVILECSEGPQGGRAPRSGGRPP